MPHPSQTAEQYPDRIACIIAETGEQISYRELDQRSNQIAHLLRAHAIAAGDAVSIFMENRAEFVSIVWGAQRSGVIFTTVSTHLKAEELAFILADSNSKMVFSSAALRDTVSAAIASDKALSAIELIDVDDDFAASIASLACTRIDDECAGRELLYSSGTTGRPKGVVVEQHGSAIDVMLPAMHGLKKMFGFDQQTRYLSPAPLYHAAPLRFVMLTMFQGGTAVIMKKFDAVAALQCIERYRITHSQWVPIMFLRMLDIAAAQRSAFDLSSMRVAIHAAAPCPVETKQAMLEWWGDIVYEYYGSTEAIGLTIISAPQWRARPGSVGRAVIGEIRIVNPEDGSLCQPGEIGDIYFANGPAVTYHNDPIKSAQARNAQGWYSCGDVGWVDKDGYLFLSDRRDFMIISGGVNIYPQETENWLLQHPQVADAAVFGVANREFGQEVKAVVQLHDAALAGADMAERLMAHCRDHISAIKCPKSIDFMPRLPRMENGKLYKKKLVSLYQ